MIDDIDTIYRHFRTLRTVEQKPDDRLDQNSLDQFFLAISKFYLTCIERGFAQVDCAAIELKDAGVKEYFITGINCIQNGMEPLAIEIIMEYMALIMNNTKTMTYRELFEMKFVEKIITFIQHGDINEYLYMLGQFCSAQTASQIQEDFKKYL